MFEPGRRRGKTQRRHYRLPKSRGSWHEFKHSLRPSGGQRSRGTAEPSSPAAVRPAPAKIFDMDCYSRTAAKFNNDDIFQLRIASVTMDNEATFASVNLLDEITLDVMRRLPASLRSSPSACASVTSLLQELLHHCYNRHVKHR